MEQQKVQILWEGGGARLLSMPLHLLSCVSKKDLVGIKADKQSIGCSRMIQNSGCCTAYNIVACTKASQYRYLQKPTKGVNGRRLGCTGVTGLPRGDTGGPRGALAILQGR